MSSNTVESIPVSLRAINLKEYKNRKPVEEDCDNLITQDCLLTFRGVPLLLYKKLDDAEMGDIRKSVRSMKYAHSNRTSYLGSKKNKNTSKVFGFMPRRVLRADYCHTSATARNYPEQHRILTSFAQNLERYYDTYFPEIFKIHKEKTEQILDQWKIGETPFTSGIINKNNQLPYHHDKGNFSGVMSNMICFKRGVMGGHLIIPELNVKLAIGDNTLVIFDGQKWLHGVTPIRKSKGEAYRYTVVYYAMKQMWRCMTPGEELERIRVLKKAREQKRITTTKSSQ